MFRHLWVILLLCFVSLILSSCARNEKKQLTEEEMVSRGKYLVTIGGCNDCHSPKVFGPHGMGIDTTRILSGQPQDLELAPFDAAMVQPGKWYLANSHLTAWVGPWGISYTANLTPDGPTGLGNWTADVFIKALRTGQHMGAGRPILPPMPWDMIRQMTDEDLRSVFAYLRTIPPIRNQVPDPVPPNMLASMSKTPADKK